MRMLFGQDVKAQAAQMQIELPGSSYFDIVSMPVSMFDDLSGTEEWRDSVKNSVEQLRFEAQMKLFSDFSKGINKSLGSLGKAIVNTIAGA